MKYIVHLYSGDQLSEGAMSGEDATFVGTFSNVEAAAKFLRGLGYSIKDDPDDDGEDLEPRKRNQFDIWEKPQPHDDEGLHVDRARIHPLEELPTPPQRRKPAKRK